MSVRQRLLVIGAHGFIGAHVARAAEGRFQCIPAARKECELAIDITDPASVASAFQKARPQVVALAAGMADIDRCQREPAIARETNVVGVWHVAKECAHSGARLLFVSSGAVFDGTCEEYREDSRPNPVSVYGASKAKAEEIVTGLSPGSVIARLSLVLGFPLRPGSNALLERLLPAMRSGAEVRAPADEYRNAIDVETVTRWILDLAGDPEARGIFHLGSSDALARYEIVRELAHALDFPRERVVPDFGPRSSRAPRGRHELLVPKRIQEVSSVAVPTCRQAIERCTHAIA